MANELTHKHFFNSPAVKQKFSEVLDGNGQQFVASLLSIVTNNNLLAKATNESIMTAAMKAATLKLPIEPSLGMAYIVPYNRNEKQGNTWVKINEAQFQMGYKGFIQLAQRSGQIRNINCDIVYKEEFFKTYDKQIGDFKSGTPWKTEFDAMAQKTLIKELLSKYAPLSTELQEAIIADNEDSNVNEVKRAKDVTPPESDNLSDLLGAPEETGGVIDQEPENGQMDMLEGEDF